MRIFSLLLGNKKKNMKYLSSYIHYILHESHYITIIGYSFPNFNREIDNQILNNKFKMSGDIVVQNPDSESQKERVSKILFKKPSNPISVDLDIKNFHIPADFIFNYD